ncbi:hypothetical protein HDU85_005754 [Gaertneriomyces sp. JEL0708]|nr:hypothetical protein HDU85_005754 [Gaertneriomyces sp. JEL0708]
MSQLTVVGGNDGDIPGPKYSYSDAKTWIALGTFLMVWLLLAKQWKIFPFGRTAGALFGGGVIVLSGVITPEEALHSVSSNTLLLLSGLMVILSKLEEKGLTSVFKRALLLGHPTPLGLLVRVSILAGVLGATVMNDGAAIFLSTVLVGICEQGEIPIEPYAMALAMNANLGSAATIIGNPKNMIVHDEMPSIDFLAFSTRMGVASCLATLLNTALVVAFYYGDLVGKRIKRMKRMMRDAVEDVFDEEDEAEEFEEDGDTVVESDVDSDIEIGEETPLMDGGIAVDIEETGEPVPPVRRGSWPTSSTEETHNDSGRSNIVQATTNGTTSAVHPRPINLSEIARRLSDDSAAAWKAEPRPSNVDVHTTTRFQSFPTALRPTPSYIFEQRQPLNLTNLAQTIPRSVPYPTTVPGVLRYHFHLAAQKVLHRISPRTLLLLFYTIVIGGMYGLFFARYPLGFTCLTAAMGLLFLDCLVGPRMDVSSVQMAAPNLHSETTLTDPTELIAEAVNWPLIAYLFGIFMVLEGVRQTPVPRDLWRLFEPIIAPSEPNLGQTVLAFCGLTIVICLVFTSIPSVVLLAPHIRQITRTNPAFGGVGWFLLAWCVTACGNLTPFGSVAGLIVSEVCKEDEQEGSKNKGRWIGDAKVWCRFALWATILELILGVGVIVWLA